jgi:hypothetical protein
MWHGIFSKNSFLFTWASSRVHYSSLPTHLLVSLSKSQTNILDGNYQNTTFVVIENTNFHIDDAWFVDGRATKGCNHGWGTQKECLTPKSFSGHCFE